MGRVKMFLWYFYTIRLFVATMFSLCDENYLWVENLFLFKLKAGDWESPVPLQCCLRQRAMDSSSSSILLIWKQWIHWIQSLSEARVEKSWHAGRDGRQGGAADDRSTDVAACHRRMALATDSQNCPFPGHLNIFRDKKLLDKDYKRPAVLMFQFWIQTDMVGCRKDKRCQWWSCFGSFRRMELGDIESLS